jgi:hypothetical protein
MNPQLLQKRLTCLLVESHVKPFMIGMPVSLVGIDPLAMYHWAKLVKTTAHWQILPTGHNR